MDTIIFVMVLGRSSYRAYFSEILFFVAPGSCAAAAFGSFFGSPDFLKNYYKSFLSILLTPGSFLLPSFRIDFWSIWPILGLVLKFPGTW